MKAVAKDGIMVDINTFENSQKKNSEGACWVNFEMTMTERETEKGGKEGEREWEILDNSLFESFENSSWGFFG